MEIPAHRYLVTGGLESRYTGNGIAGSNPTLSIGVTQFSTAFPQAGGPPFWPQRTLGLEAVMTRKKAPVGAATLPRRNYYHRHVLN